MLPVNEVFATIQGEGFHTGIPAWFIRLQGCPVGCPWCDTKHTWSLDASGLRDWSVVTAAQREPDSTYATLDFESLWLLLESRPYIRHVVLTGGEPCLYDLTGLTGEVITRGYTVQVETSCTLEARVSPGTWITGSPKLNMPGGLSVSPSMLSRADEIKFPVGKQSDIDRLCHDVIPHVRPGRPVYLQPLSQSSKATALCVAMALEHGFRLSAQVHKYIGIR